MFNIIVEKLLINFLNAEKKFYKHLNNLCVYIKNGYKLISKAF